MSYLLSGGLEMVTPWTPLTTEEYPMLKIEDTTAMQLDFTEGNNVVFAEADCDVFGQAGYNVGMQLCIAADAAIPGILNAGTSDPIA